ncbi:MAG TPA: alanine--glyoxylate aminotransferase family protein [Thermoanaerobaculia bacterium]|nr:alanine--glyoxylate aminotransferase family protein [Thermoanaerobaculia bacterium]
MEKIQFFLPGPTYVPEDARQAMAAPVVGHRSAGYRTFYQSIAGRLPAVLRTAGEVLTATGSSTLIMESAVISTAAASVLSLTNGAFSERWHAISRGAGKAADRLSAPWGEAIDPDLVRGALRRKRYDAVTLVHNETSTGVMNPLAEIARAIREESDALVLVDAVSSLGGAPVEADAWGLDVVLAGTQKALALPPGLVVFTLSDRAAERAAKVERRGFYTDLLRYRDKHREGGAITTPAVSLFYALDRQLERILAEGMEARWARHQRLYRRTAEWAAARGFTYTAAESARSWTVSCLRPPAGIDPQALVKQLAGRGWIVGGGYGDWKPTTFRIGHMGEVRDGDLEALLAEIDQLAAARAIAAPAAVAAAATGVRGGA